MIPPAGRILSFILDRIDDADEEAAVDRVEQLRRQQREWSTEQLVDELVRRKCRQTAAVGAATAGAGVIPGLGTLVALTVGAVADLSVTLRLQTELVLEIAEAHRRQLSKEEKRRVVLLVGGLSAGSGRLFSRGGAQLSLRLTQRYAQRWVARAVPFAGVAAAAGANALSTYLIGRRAHALFSHGPDAVGSWAESLRALSGVDERKLAAWLQGLRKRGTSEPESATRQPPE